MTDLLNGLLGFLSRIDWTVPLDLMESLTKDVDPVIVAFVAVMMIHGGIVLVLKGVRHYRTR